jgi:hypothetical protein
MGKQEAPLRLIPHEVLDMEATGLGFPPAPLRQLLGDGPKLLAFLRHFG